MTPADILEQCLNEIEGGRKTPAECAAQFPDVPDLEAQLRAAQFLRAYPVPTLRPAASHQIENRLRRQVAASQRPGAAPRRLVSAGWRWAIGLLLVVASLRALVQAVVVSVPGEVLYPAKRLAETAQLRLSPPTAQATQQIAFAERRLMEIAQLAKHGQLQPEELAQLLADFNQATEAAWLRVNDAAPSQQARLLAAIVQAVELEAAMLQSLRPDLPPQTLAVIQPALLEADAQMTRAEERLSAMDLPPTARPSLTPTLIRTLTPTGTRTFTPTSTEPATLTPPNPDPTRTPPVPTSSTSTLSPTSIAPSATPLPPEPTSTPAGQWPTPTATLPEPTSSPTPPGPPVNPPNCHAPNPASPNYCTPTPLPDSPTEAPPTASPTPCATNASGRPHCRP